MGVEPFIVARRYTYAAAFKRTLIAPLTTALPERLLWYVLPVTAVLCSVAIATILFGAKRCASSPSVALTSSDCC